MIGKLKCLRSVRYVYLRNELLSVTTLKAWHGELVMDQLIPCKIFRKTFINRVGVGDVFALNSNNL